MFFFSDGKGNKQLFIGKIKISLFMLLSVKNRIQTFFEYFYQTLVQINEELS